MTASEPSPIARARPALPRRRSDPRSRLTRRWPFWLLVLLLVLMALADRAGWLLAKASDDLARYDRVNAIVLRVIDGDTLDIAMADPVTGKDVTRVRLWGIDCPELGRPAQGSSPATSTKPGAEDAMAMSRDLAEHSTVVLVLEAHRLRDRHRRLLAHVDLADGTRLNERLLKAGMARADDRWSHSMQRRYAQLEAAARRTGAGIWAQGQPPSLGAD